MHPAETLSSFMLDGIINFLLLSKDSVSKQEKEEEDEEEGAGGPGVGHLGRRPADERRAQRLADCDAASLLRDRYGVVQGPHCVYYDVGLSCAHVSFVCCVCLMLSPVCAARRQ